MVVYLEANALKIGHCKQNGDLTTSSLSLCLSQYLYLSIVLPVSLYPSFYLSLSLLL